MAGQPKTSGAAIASIICGGLSLLCSCLTALPGLITGIVALSSIGKSNGRLKGKGLAITGIILSLAFPVIQVLVVPAIMASNPEFRKMIEEISGAVGKSQELATQGTELAGALKAYSSANGNRLPASLQELIDQNLVSTAAVKTAIEDGTWQLTHPGVALSEVPAGEPLAKGGPISVMNEEVWVFIDQAFNVVPQDARGQRR